MDGERGASTVEYVGVIVLVAALVASLIMAATPVGQVIAAKICEAFGATCGSAASADDPNAPPSQPCVVSTDTQQAGGSISIAFVDLGGGRTMVTQKYSDGTYTVSISDDGSLGATLTAGEAKGGLKIMGYGGTLELSASASAADKLQGGDEYTFTSKKQVDDFHDWAYRQFGKDAAKTVVGGAGLGFGIDGLNWVVDKVTGYDYSPPDPTSTYIQGGIVVSGEANASGIVAGVGAAANSESAIGYRQNLKTGENTIYSKVTLDASVAADLGFSSLADAEGNVSIIIGSTLDENGTLTGVSFDGTATAQGSYSLTKLTQTPLSSLQTSGGTGIDLKASFPVTDANRQQTLEALGGLGVTKMIAGNTILTQAAALPWILDAAHQDGDVTAQTLNVSSQDIVDAGLDLKAPAVGGLGFGLDVGTNSTSSKNAWYLGEHGWNEWEACK